ncbi:TIGR04211 family SH3 domain-containing protein [Alloalcanivorax xenomutans]|jgi:SH3 domain protein|uniref:TIGR04211 family SH3 domain-containing protein n=1 Tax=Alloalcanivorax xenomutans TaxID=1094342 RepID=UPI00047B648F|nr:TIGR04211 family SH3 domain-containing protein [Alloalcanivorax xenomutans]MBA4720341.1 TIGR04211 family SH3 domain-containing protein [Alcanivorax sp.]MCE7523924.1 TIGR04211 family SH3 domain-containing protein [Alloalcanivorax xenomutans]WOA29501.1 TIGR04211 family SH3 domain-containing protein [Alloalcanivorax xenomutans]WOD26480.1 TIGR04211 family SH3 domain-containing protein [Alloalcanivorax xenomutans]CUR47230.1 hypothetical protein BN2364_2789 [Alloalcanivorax xenomutans]
MRNRWLSGLLMLALCLPAPVYAAAAWIGDEIYVPMRAGAGTGYRIVHRGIKSGTRVELLGEEGDWIHIRYGNREGYVEKQYISRTPTAALRLQKLTQDTEKATSTASDLRRQMAELEGQRDALRGEVEELRSSLTSRSNELDQLRNVAADPIRLDQANRRLNEELSMLRSELDQVKAENALLRNDNTSRKWITGVGILLLGAIGGLLLKSKSGRRRNNWAN